MRFRICRRSRSSAHARDGLAELGFTMVEVVVALVIVGLLVTGAVVSGSRFTSEKTLSGWCDTIVSDPRAGQALAIARRASAVITFVSGSGTSYTVVVGGTTVRQDTLPAEISVTGATITFNSLGIPSSTTAVTVQVTDSVTGSSHTVTVAPVTGAVSVQ